MIHGSVGGARKRGVERGSAFNLPEAHWTGSAMALKESESEALRKLVPPTSLIFIIGQIEFNHFDDIFALKWLISIISMHGVIEKVEFNGAQLSSWCPNNIRYRKSNFRPFWAVAPVGDKVL